MHVPVSGKNLLFHELVGLHFKVHRSPCDALVGVEGRVVDETMNTLIIREEDGHQVCILKKSQTFMVTLPEGKKILVPGNLLIGRPWDRLKNIGKKQYK